MHPNVPNFALNVARCRTESGHCQACYQASAFMRGLVTQASFIQLHLGVFDCHRQLKHAPLVLAEKSGPLEIEILSDISPEI